MPRDYLITFTTVSGIVRKKKIRGTSKYDAKRRFYHEYPKCSIIKMEVCEDEDRSN